VDGGATELDNLVLLCRRHHTFVHEYGYRIEWDAQSTQFVAPGRRPIPTRCPLPKSPSAPIEQLAEAHEDHGLSLGAPPLMPQKGMTLVSQPTTARITPTKIAHRAATSSTVMSRPPSPALSTLSAALGHDARSIFPAQRPE